MVYTDQQIGDLARQLDAKGAGASKIREFVSRAKAEQKAELSARRTGPAGIEAKGPSGQTFEAPKSFQQKLGENIAAAPGEFLGGLREATAPIRQGIDTAAEATGANQWARDISGAYQETKQLPLLKEGLQAAEAVSGAGQSAIEKTEETLNRIVGKVGEEVSLGVNPAERLKRFVEQGVTGIGNLAGGTAELGYNATGLSAVNPFDTRTALEKSEASANGLNKFMGGAWQTMMSPLAGSPLATDLAGMPFEALHEVVKEGVDAAGIDPDSEYGRNTIDLYMNSLGLLLMSKKGVTKEIESKGAKEFAKETGKTFTQAPKMAWELPGMTKKMVGTVAENVAMFTKSPAKRLKFYKQELENTVGTILRNKGDLKQVEKGKRALGELDLEGVKTPDQLAGTIGDKIKVFSEKIDAELVKQKPEAMPLDAFTRTIKGKTKSLEVNYVKNALDQLLETYEVTGEIKEFLRIDELITKAETEGLTLLEANNIAREYGREFKRKSFNKQGDPLTSVNAKMYENTRTGVKETVRDFMPDEMTKEIDSKLSDLIFVKEQVSKTADNARRLRYTVMEKTFKEKAWGEVANAIDLMSMGAFRGMIRQWAPRNVGYKTINYLDLKSSLPKLLERFERVNEIVKKSEEPITPKEVREILMLPAPKEGEKGRVVPIKVHVENHAGSLDVARRLLDKGEDISLIDNSLGFGKSKVFDKKKFDNLKMPDGLQQTLETIVEDYYKKDKITKEQYDSLLGNKAGVVYNRSQPASFLKSINSFKNKRKEYDSQLTLYELKDYSKMKTFLSDDGLSGYAIQKDGTLSNVFSLKKGRGNEMIQEAIRNGAKKLDAFDGYLVNFYTKNGFKEVNRLKWDKKYAPKNWDYEKFGTPDIVEMKFTK